jgi:glutaminyl-tRNA synthetase
MTSPASDSAAPRHFLAEWIDSDLASGRVSRVVTRFPPEPNGYLHIGHAKAVCVDFGMAAAYGGECHLRMDDTNPVKEDPAYTRAIQEDVRWLGFQWEGEMRRASDYFETMYELAEKLIREGKAYVCELPQEAWKDYRGVPTSPGRPSPYRDRPAEESLSLFRRMRAGEFPDGSKVLRAKLDMASPNLHLRDPVLYRILHADHPNAPGWNVYPMYDFAHPIEDAIEGVTHSMCTLEFEVHRPLYDWVIRECGLFESRQREFARLELAYTVMSKRRLLEMVELGLVRGWDDPRMPTLAGLRRRGVPPEAIRAFCEAIGVTKYDSLTDPALLDHCVRDVLNRTAPRAMAVFDPLPVSLENPEDLPQSVQAVNNPEDPEGGGTREVPFSANLFIEREDFAEIPPPKFKRLVPGGSVRLRHAGFLTCTAVEKDEAGNVTGLKGRFTPMDAAMKVKATIHWVAQESAREAEVRLYDRLFTVPEPCADKERDYKEFFNRDSEKVVSAFVEPSLATAEPGSRFQFERIGYFSLDKDSAPGAPVFNRIATLKDSK